MWNLSPSLSAPPLPPHSRTSPTLLAVLCLGLGLSACQDPSRSGPGGENATGGGNSTGSGGTTSGDGSGGTGGSPGNSGPWKSSSELIAELSLGWNLGNSLDVPEGETLWGNPLTTAAHLQTVSESGFDLVRIPVTWSLRMGEAPTFTIDPAWLLRVEEVVGYALDAGLHVIINLHHDGADNYEGVEWLSLNDSSGAVTDEHNAAVRERFVTVWEQIAEHFKDYGQGLLFESMNEIHDGYGEPDPRYHDIINDLNQVFVETVRQSGGNNVERHLVVPGYNTNIGHTLAGFVRPNDPTPDRLILSVHYYDPWDFAGSGMTHVWGQDVPGNDGWGQEPHVVQQFDRLKTTYADAGLPVLIGEYGAVHQTGYEPYRVYYMEYVTKAAADRGFLPVYWDNGSKGSGEEAFGLLARDTLEVLHPDVLSAMVRAATSSYSLEDITPPAP